MNESYGGNGNGGHIVNPPQLGFDGAARENNQSNSETIISVDELTTIGVEKNSNSSLIGAIGRYSLQSTNPNN